MINNKYLQRMMMDELLKRGQWIAKNSAIVVFHGIGYQKPLETLDIFVRGLLETYVKAGFDAQSFTLTHQLAKKEDGRGGYWYENFIRIIYKDSAYYLDCYEFYWAPATEDKVSWSDTQNWIKTLTRGANKFYKEKQEQGEYCQDDGFFFPNGVFNKTWIHIITPFYLIRINCSVMVFYRCFIL